MQKEIYYTPHLRFRLKLRNIPYELPKRVYKQAKEHYYDSQTGHNIALSRVKFKDKIKEFAVTYDKIGDRIEIVTIHPLKTYQKQARLKSERWRRL